MTTFHIQLNFRAIKDSNEKFLLLRITHKRNSVRLKLLYSINPIHFNAKGKNFKYIRSSHPDHMKINNYLQDKIAQAKEAVALLEKEGKNITLQAIRDRINKPKSSDLFVFAEGFKNDLLKHGSAGNYKKYRTIVNSLKSFVNKDELFFNEINLDFLARYQSYLKEIGNTQTTIHGYVGRIRSLFNKAIRAGVLDMGSTPFTNYKIKQGKVTKDRLNIEEIEKIENLKLESGSLIWHVKNIFLFSFYNAGIRISDILLMRWDNIINGRLSYKMFKTTKSHSLILLEKPLAILELYKGKSETYIFPFLSEKYDYSDAMFLHDQIVAKTALINKYLKDLAKKAGISKKITTHTARHSFADIARQKTDNLYNLSKTLGHSSIKVTEAYLASFDEKAVDDTLDSVFK
jgi:integrase